MPCVAVKRGASLEEKLPGSADLEQRVHLRKTSVHLKSPCSCSRKVFGGSLWPGEHFAELSLHVQARVPFAKASSSFRTTQQSVTWGGIPFLELTQRCCLPLAVVRAFSGSFGQRLPSAYASGKY